MIRIHTFLLNEEVYLWKLSQLKRYTMGIGLEAD